jgi:hypothetical protein
MRPSVNYYHYSVYILLGVNLRTLSKSQALAEKKFFDFGLATARRLTRLRPQQLANDPVLLTIAWLKKISDSGSAASASGKPASTLSPTHETGRSVDKPMNIHRSECAKPRDLATAGFLSSFGPRQKQALSSSSERR